MTVYLKRFPCHLSADRQKHGNDAFLFSCVQHCAPFTSSRVLHKSYLRVEAISSKTPSPPLFASVLFSKKVQTAKSAGFYSCRGFNTPPLWGEIKGIKPECNSLAERTIPRTLCVGVRSFQKNQQHLYKPDPFARLSPNVDETQECTIFQVCAFCIDKHCAPFTTLRQSAKLAVLLDITKNVD